MRVPAAQSFWGSTLCGGLCLFILGTGIGSSPANAVEPEDESRLHFRPTVGYTSMALSDVTDLYDDVVDEYRNDGVPIGTQREFRGNVLGGLDVLFDFSPAISIGGGADYTWTRAFSAYGDPNGTLDIAGRVHRLGLRGLVEVRPTVSASMRPFFMLAIGADRSSLRFTEEILLTDFPDASSTGELTASGWGLGLGASLGAVVEVGPIPLIGQIGYRYSKLNDPDGDLKIDGESESLGKLDLTIDNSGLFAAVGVSLKL